MPSTGFKKLNLGVLYSNPKSKMKLSALNWANSLLKYFILAPRDKSLDMRLSGCPTLAATNRLFPETGVLISFALLNSGMPR